MGNGALFATIAVVGATLLLLFNTQIHSQETGRRELVQQANHVARELAMTGRKLVLADWVEANGASSTQPFSSVNRDGGLIRVVDYDNTAGSANSVLDFTVQASYDSVVHEVRSRFRWSNVSLNAVQLKAGDIAPTFSPASQFNFTDIALDNTSLLDLESILVADLGLIGDLSEIGLGLTDQQTTLEDEFTNNGHTGMAVHLIDQAFRDAHANQDGVLYPDQISQAIELFELSNPSMAVELSDVSSLNGSFGLGDGYEMLTVSGDLTLDADLQGQGVLVVEGNFIVPDGISFEWDGVVLVRPAAQNLNPTIDFSGQVNIEGSFVALHEGMPNVGHMDLSVYRDMTGSWITPTGNEAVHEDILNHTHDYTALAGNYVVFHSDDPMQPNHETYTLFNETLGNVASTDSVFFEIFNNTAHGFGLIGVDLTTGNPVGQSVAAGFDPSIRAAGNAYRTKPFPVDELEHFDIRIMRLSALKKLWDVAGQNYPGCVSEDGPYCVWHDYNRQGALTLRLYTKNFFTEKMVYAASLYWHRRKDEEEEFNDEMQNLISTIQSSNYGLDLNIGDNTTITADVGALLGLGAFGTGSGFGTLGVEHLGTWHRQWDRNDPGNPLF